MGTSPLTPHLPLSLPPQNIQSPTTKYPLYPTTQNQTKTLESLHFLIKDGNPIQANILHTHLTKTLGIQPDVTLETKLLNLYLKNDHFPLAQKLFDEMPERNTVTWTSMVSGLSQMGLHENALRVLIDMHRSCVELNEFTFVSALSACANLPSLRLGEQIHGHMIKAMVINGIHGSTALIDMYSKCGSIGNASDVFERMEGRNMVTWGAMISGLVHNGLELKALELFSEMMGLGFEPNDFTVAIALGACGSSHGLDGPARELHGCTIKFGLSSNCRVANAILTMYARKGWLNDLMKVFDGMPKRDHVSWSAAINGLAQTGYDLEALHTLRAMHRARVHPTEHALAGGVSSCARAAGLAQGQHLHGLAIKLGHAFKTCSGNALVTMYAKAGSLTDAMTMFDVISSHNTMSYNALIHAHACHGHAKEALALLQEMSRVGFQPDGVTLLGVMHACSHAGYPDHVCKIMHDMHNLYGIRPHMEHYACMVDGMVRAGRLREAAGLVFRMPYEPDGSIWKAILFGCKVHGDIKLGKYAAKIASKCEPGDPAAYVLLSNAHAMRGEWADVERVREEMERRCVKKEAGCSWIEMRGSVHVFLAKDVSHSRTSDIYACLENLLLALREVGYAPDLSFA
ncbi:hypothetical protein AMTR_s00066p00062930 [Amborella trichopoda]|uniref:DYW domain-containing protein n=1 Tax=Amborella trichopoda TaxID=13333 RepID=U5DHV7_AMBTC|nr:hypothetical protein AMTR_s00066p00062930 [Amborella trichopoda]